MDVQVQGSLDGATGEAAEPPLAGGTQTIWWSWTAPQSGVAVFSLDGYILNLFRGSSLPGLVDLIPRIDRQFVGFGGPFLIPVTEGDSVQVCAAAFGGGPVTLYIHSYPLPEAPVNDNFASRTAVNSAEYQTCVTLANSSLEPGEPDPAYRQPALPGFSGTLWWSYTAPVDGMLRLWTDSKAYSLILALYQGNDLSSLALIQNTNAGYGQISLPVKRGDIYQISLAGPSLLLDSYNLFFETLGPPNNDSFADAVQLEGSSLAVTGRTVGATQESGEPAAAPNSPGHTVWYSWVADCTARVRPVPSAPNSTPVLAVYTGPALDHLTRVPMSVYRPFEFVAIKDTVYNFQVDGSGSENFTLNLSRTPILPAVNDNFADAVQLCGSANSSDSSLLGTTVEPGEPAHLGATAAQSVWWKWQASLNGQYYVDAQNSLPRDCTLAMYTGTSVDALTLVTKGVGLMQVNAKGGEFYYIAGAAAAGAIGDIVLTIYPGLSDGTTYAVPGNLIQNPSFESQTSSAWGYLNCGGSVNEDGGQTDGRGYPLESMLSRAQ
jgi:hypothetical protein